VAEIICVIGNKGGTGKTTLSHMLCQGLGLLNQRSVCVLTDVGREPLDPDGRRYLTADARSRESLSKVVDKIRGLNKWIGVIDGGANRSDMDRHLYGLAHLVLLPFRDSHEDMRTVQQDLEAFPRALALPMQWPTNSWAREAADRTVESLLGSLSQPDSRTGVRDFVVEATAAETHSGHAAVTACQRLPPRRRAGPGYPAHRTRRSGYRCRRHDRRTSEMRTPVQGVREEMMSRH
jgi:hypothetical protein